MEEIHPLPQNCPHSRIPQPRQNPIIQRTLRVDRRLQSVGMHQRLYEDPDLFGFVEVVGRDVPDQGGSFAEGERSDVGRYERIGR